MKTAERVVMVAIVVVLMGSVSYVYLTMKANHQAVLDEVARGDYEIPLNEPAASAPVVPSEVESDWQAIYPDTVPMKIAEVVVQASVADTLPKRIAGLSGTPYLPAAVVKLFAFNAAGSHSIWMKDMNYSIDIIWVSKEGEIVHIEENISPETFPESFGSPIPAWYVIEAKAGFVEMNQVRVGDPVTLPEALL
jgi:uncharacterized membrane protein (UPF0127 family)